MPKKKKKRQKGIKLVELIGKEASGDKTGQGQQQRAALKSSGECGRGRELLGEDDSRLSID